MRPNYKAAAKKYREKYHNEILSKSELLYALRSAVETNVECKEELTEWKHKYTELLGRLIALQESIAQKEGKQ